LLKVALNTITVTPHFITITTTMAPPIN
jgi:hypothetical protein